MLLCFCLHFQLPFLLRELGGIGPPKKAKVSAGLILISSGLGNVHVMSIHFFLDFTIPDWDSMARRFNAPAVDFTRLP